ncbi:hypothetical protein A9A59_1977 [Tepidiforma thermophila]|uniref:Uncharacterized protein n=1 Tax=Tepidiforma thermophila (strain KCTC 52669 / CGMCC 1.13589 / G233) TaxID=2761530 RepID=A0A2A9HID5_TEPT2|nr:hypothetical protein A9A59_1977 [Tepidiforma thermophila]
MLLIAAAPAVPAGAAGPCLEVDPAAPDTAVLAANVIVLGKVVRVADGPQIVPEAFLKGTVTRQAVHLPAEPRDLADCAPAELPAEARVLAFLAVADGTPAWPGSGAVFILQDGQAARVDGKTQTMSERELVERIRALTGQLAAPPAEDESAAGIDWTGTIVPVGGLLLGVFAIGLVLMRVWHRIDPS